MSENSKKAVAVFIICGSHDEKNDAAKQTVLRDCAAKLCLTIVSFVALPKISLFQRLSQTLGICRLNSANILLVDELKTLFLSHQELINFLKISQENKISIVSASSKALLTPEYLGVLSELLQTSIQAEANQRAKNIKKSLWLKRRQGVTLGGKKFGVIHEESEIIKQILELKKAGKTLQEICNILSTNDIKSMHNKKWHPTTIKRIINRETK